MTTTTSPAKAAALGAVQALVAAAATKLAEAALHMGDDAQTLTSDGEFSNDFQRMNFAIGALLPLEELTADLAAILTAARALQRV